MGNDAKKVETVEVVYATLLNKYKKHTLRKNEIADELGMTTATLRKHINNGATKQHHKVYTNISIPT